MRLLGSISSGRGAVRARKAPLAVALDLLEPRRLLAAAPALVQDINPGTEDSSPRYFTELGGGRAAFYEAQGLYVTDATAAGTIVVKDNVRLLASSLPDSNGLAQTASLGGSAFFVAEDVVPTGAAPVRLWRTDGTAAGTRAVFTFPSGDATAYDLAAAGGSLYLSTGPDGTRNPDGTFTGHGPQLWRYNPAAGTMTLIREFKSSDTPAGFVAYGGKVFFSGSDDPTRRGLWSTDGTPAGTVEVSATGPGADMVVSSPPVVAGNYLYFAGNTAAAGVEPWRSDGTAAGTVQVANIATGTASSSPNSFAGLPNGEAVFTAAGKLYKSNANGTYALIFAPGNFNPVYHSVYRAGNTVYVDTTERNANPTLWKTDGTDAGTFRIADTSPNDSAGSGAEFLGELNGKLLFTAFGTGIGWELWSSDGTPAGTAMVKDINPTLVWGPSAAFFGSGLPSDLVVSGGRAFFAANDGVHGREPFVTDGTAAGTRQIADLNVFPVDSNPGDTYGGAQAAATLNGLAYFPSRPSYLTRSDGTDAGTQNLARYVGGSLKFVTAWNGSLYFLWVSSTFTEVLRFGGGPNAGDVSLTTASGTPTDPKRDFFVPYKGKLYFLLGNALWGTDGTAAGTARITPTSTTLQGPNWLTAAGDDLFFVSSGELWVSDGTAAGTRRFSAVTTAINTQSAKELTAIGDVLYFSAGSSSIPTLYKTDGTAAGSTMLAEPTTTGNRLSFWGANSLTPVGSTLYFSATAPTVGGQTASGLWKSDGTRAGTVPVQAPTDPGRAVAARFITAAAGRLYFAGYDPATGYELWTSDGTAAGTRRLSDINPGPADAFDRSWPDTDRWRVFAAGEHVFFTARDGAGDVELWEVADQGGRVARVADVYPGPTGADPRPMAVVSPGGAPTLLFSAADPVHGRELWRADAGPLPAGVAGRYVFYNDSAFDGGDAAADARDDAAIAADKAALLPGQPAGFSTVTSSPRGITGVMIDVAGLPQDATPLPADFATRTGAGGDPAAWAAGPAPLAVSVRRGAGASGTDRVTLLFPEGTARNGWLQVTVRPGPRTGLAAADVFTFGNLAGATGPGGAGAPAAVTSAGAMALRGHLSAGTATVTDPYDINRDGRVNALDLTAVLRNLGHTLTAPATPAAAAAAVVSVPAAGPRSPARRSGYFFAEAPIL